MKVPEEFSLKNTIKYPTSLIIGGVNRLGFEIADSLIDQGGYVILIDNYTEENIAKLKEFPKDTLISFLDYSSIPHLDEDLRRLDYVFYFQHQGDDFTHEVSTQQFLNFSNYIDTILTLSSKFEAKFLLTTAIKAHQIEMASHEVNLEYSINANQKHKIYTVAEVQKYAESLVMEYHEKVKLDTRITRLGELIGEGMDFLSQTVTNELLLSAVNSHTLKLKKDGLETEWLVHILDAAYAIIKAQFTKATTGRIYSVSYENALTHLSIAYKIQESEENSPEIQFVDEKDNLPSLKLYKPAPNLSQIGWSTKIPFDKAIAQSLAAAKIFSIEHKLGVKKYVDSDDEKNVVNKLMKFINVAGKEEIETGAISRLLEERRNQEELKKQRMEIASSVIKTRKNKRNRTFKEKVKTSFWDNFIAFGNTVAFFKNRSPFEVGLILFTLVFLIFAYFAFISPTLVLVRNGLSIYPDYKKLQEQYQANNWSELETTANNMNKNLGSSVKILNAWEKYAKFVALDDEIEDTVTILENYQLFLEGVGNTAYGLSPLQEYLTSYENNTQLRAGTDSFISSTTTGVNYENVLLELSDRKAYVNLGIDKINKANNQLLLLNYGFLPANIFDRVKSVNEQINLISSNSKNFSNAKYIPELLGVFESRTYLFFLLDNTRPMPIGGDLSAFALVTLQNGSITEIVVQTPDEVSFNLDELDQSTLDLINQTRFTYKNASDLKLNDFGSILSFEDYSFFVSQIFENTYNREIDGVVTLNLNSLQKILDNLKTQNGSNFAIEVDGVNFAGGNLLENLEAVQLGNESILVKRKALAQVFASVWNVSLQTFDQSALNLISALSEGIKNSDVLVSISSSDFEEYINDNNLAAENIFEASAYVNVAVINDDFRLVNPERLPSITISNKVTIGSTLNLDYDLNLTLSNTGTTQEVAVCMPLGVANSSISVSGIESTRFTINTAGESKCVVAKVINETNLNFSWSLNDAFTMEDSVNIKLATSKVKGEATTLDTAIIISPDLQLVSIMPNLTRTGNEIGFRENLTKDQLIELELSN